MYVALYRLLLGLLYKFNSSLDTKGIVELVYITHSFTFYCLFLSQGTGVYPSYSGPEIGYSLDNGQLVTELTCRCTLPLFFLKYTNKTYSTLYFH